jgi:hypothetical protein
MSYEIIVDMTAKRRRTRPRRLTPPITLRSEDGERAILTVDEQLETNNAHWTSHITTCVVDVGAGMTVMVGSYRRGSSKTRLPRVIIRRVPVCEERMYEQDARRVSFINGQDGGI